MSFLGIPQTSNVLFKKWPLSGLFLIHNVEAAEIGPKSEVFTLLSAPTDDF